MNKKRIIKSNLDLSNPPPLTPRQKEMIKTLKALPDSEIDYSDIPPLDFHCEKSMISWRMPANHE